MAETRKGQREQSSRKVTRIRVGEEQGRFVIVGLFSCRRGIEMSGC